MKTVKTLVAVGMLGVVTSIWALPSTAHAWGDEGHEIVALIADHYLNATTRSRVQALLAGDKSSFTAHDVAAEATWADKYRDSDRDTTKIHYDQTHEWHFVDIEISKPDIKAACFHQPALPSGTLASAGPAKDCVVDKVEQFKAELAAASTTAAERLLALQFLLHLVGDLHQPLHACDDHDGGGNAKKVTAQGHEPGTLHHYWDVEFVRPLGSKASDVAAALVAKITPNQVKTWTKSSASTWALEASRVARTHGYKPLPKPDAAGVYALSPKYVTDAERAVAEQLKRAGVRLAAVLNDALK